MMRIKTLIVDDEPLARANLRVLAEADRDVEVVGECVDGEAAIAAIEALEPEVILLDVHMPNVGGIDLLERLDAPPLIVFVTAHEDYALRAFEEGAVDYLLKPFDDQRFATMMMRVKERIAERRRSSATLVDGDTNFPARILVKGMGRTLVIQIDEIDWIGGAGNYVRLNLGTRSVLHRATIAETLAQLDPTAFVRIHRSTIVNVSRVRQLEPIAKGAWRVRLANGTELRLSAAYREDLESRLLANT